MDPKNLVTLESSPRPRPDPVRLHTAFGQFSPRALLLSKSSRDSWMFELAGHIGRMGGSAAHFASTAVSPAWLLSNIWAVKAAAPWANMCIVEEFFAGESTETIDFLLALRLARQDLVLILVTDLKSSRDSAADLLPACDATIRLPCSASAFSDGVSAALANHRALKRK